MPRMMSVRLWQIGKRHERGVSLRAALEQIWALGDPDARERQLAPGVRCRLERLTVDGGTIIGEMTRVRHEDHPREVHPDGARPLNVQVPIGDGVAFRYRIRDHRLAFQYDDRILSAGRFLDYIEVLVDGALFDSHPVLDEEEMERFRSQPLKKVTIKVANPTEVASTEDSMRAAASSFRQLGEAYNAPTVTLEMSVGTSRSFLAESAKRMLLGIIRETPEEDLRAARAVPGDARGGRAKEVNLLDSLFSHKELVDTPRDLDENFEARQRLLRRVLERQA
ncbi:hypothetical protein [Sphingomonas sp. IC4-52]|uniref:hypothetical protein n=1 Tax=Sphingomonas sp. IC4-52 TaxID=2887202 RepID=UPI001D12B8D0|nr:hypothetical protein [Sphingomonas sp. IC4-52]MCC2981264.1 hypothetical protein [Sphingomonas sp. IC4-52]